MTLREDAARSAVELVEATYPGALRLAVLLSPAVRIEPELLRAVRLTAAPHLRASDEADLWFSLLIASRGPDAISLEPAVAELLRHRLAEESRAAPARRAWAAIERMHATASPALVLEERIAKLATFREAGWEAGVQHELDRALVTLHERPVAGVARWAVRACPRLPQEVQGWARALQLRESAGALVLLRRRGDGDDAPAIDLDALALERPTTLLLVRRAGRLVIIGDRLPGQKAVAVPVPDIDPRLIELRWQGSDSTHSQDVSLRPGDVKTLDVGIGSVQLRCLGGAVYELPQPSQARVVALYARDDPVGRELAHRLTTEAAGIEFFASDDISRLEDGYVVFWSKAFAARWTSRPAAMTARRPVLPVLIDDRAPPMPSELAYVDALSLLTDAVTPNTDQSYLVRRIIERTEEVFGTVAQSSADATAKSADAPRAPTATEQGRTRRAFVELVFDANGKTRGSGVDELLDMLSAGGVTDVLMFAHGWNQDATSSRTLADNFFTLLERVGAEALSHGVLPQVYVSLRWPSMIWSDELDETLTSAGGSELTEHEVTEQLKAAFPGGADQLRLDELGQILDAKRDSRADLERSHELIVGLSPRGRRSSASTDPAELLGGPAEQVFDRFAAAAGPEDDTDAGSGGLFSRLWRGAKQALRTVTYFQMNARAESVGANGLGPVLEVLGQRAPHVRVHLVAHSMGVRLIAAALESTNSQQSSSIGLPTVGSVVLLQGEAPATIFSTTPRLGQSSGFSGAGAKVATFSSNDAVLRSYFGVGERLVRKRTDLPSSDNPDTYQALGFVGFRGVEPHEVEEVLPVGRPYAFRQGWFYSIDCGQVIHSHADIRKPEVAWLVLQSMWAVKDSNPPTGSFDGVSEG